MNLIKFFFCKALLIMLFLLFFFQLVHTDDASFTITIVPEPKNYSGICPIEVKFRIKFSTNLPSLFSISYQLIRSDGTKSGRKIITLSKFAPQKSIEYWKLNRSYSGWVAIRVLSPIFFESKQAHFSVQCRGDNYL